MTLDKGLRLDIIVLQVCETCRSEDGMLRRSGAVSHMRLDGYSHYPFGRFELWRMRVEIKFENERELIDGIMESGLNLHTLIVLLLDRFGVMLNKASEAKIDNAQAKISAERVYYENWASRQENVYCIEDVLKCAEENGISVGGQGEAYALVEHQIGLAKRGTIWQNDFRYYSGKYYFNDGGCQTITYLFYARGWYGEEDLQRLRELLGIFFNPFSAPFLLFQKFFKGIYPLCKSKIPCSILLIPTKSLCTKWEMFFRQGNKKHPA